MICYLRKDTKISYGVIHGGEADASKLVPIDVRTNVEGDNTLEYTGPRTQEITLRGRKVSCH